jgi:Uncharacterized conserved protein
MEIIVQGEGESFYTPDQVVLSFNFFIKENTYEEALTNGSVNVLEFVNNILLAHGFFKEDMKTNSFHIKKETIYNEITRTYDFKGYSYNQNATLKFDYNKEKLSKIMEDISKMSRPPFYNVDFTVKDVKACKKDNLTKAYKNAEEQAQIIAEAAGKVLVNCAKTDFKPFTTEFISKGYNCGSSYLDAEKSIGMAKMSAAETINAVFTPQDILISETLYCLWIAE